MRFSRLRIRSSIGGSSRPSQRARPIARLALIAAPTLFAGLFAASVFVAHGPTQVTAAGPTSQACFPVCLPTPSLPVPTPPLPSCTALPTPPSPFPSLPICTPTPTPAPPTPTPNPGGNGGPPPSQSSGGTPPPAAQPPGSSTGGIAPPAAVSGGTTAGVPAPGGTTGGISAPYQVTNGFPAGGVLGVNVPPLPTPYNFSAAPPSSTVDRTGGDPSMILPTITDMASPEQIPLTLSSIGQSALIALVLLALLALPVQFFNAILRETNGDRRTWLHANVGGLRRWAGVFARVPQVIGVGVFILAGSVLYAALDPSFGVNLTTAAVVLAMIGALLAVTLGHDLVRRVYVRVRFHRRTRLTARPANLLFAVALVLLSRAFHFQPGLIFGLMTGLAFSDRVSDREEGHGLAVAAFIVLGLSFVSWFAWVPVRSAVATSPNPGFWLIALDTLLVTIWVVGVQSVAFALLPARFTGGDKVMSWSRAGWLAILYMTLFVFVHAIMQPTTERFGQQPSVISLAAVLFAVTVLAAGVWVYSALRHRRIRRVSPAAG